MSEFSASDAAIAGFRLIGRRWRVVIGWSMANLLIVIATAIVASVIVVAIGAAAGASPVAAVIAGAIGLLATLLAGAILVCGVFRVMLRPQEPAYLFLRVGKEEARLVVVWLIGLVAWGALAAAIALAGRALQGQGGLAGGLAFAVVPIALAIWLGVRFSLAGVISFAERRIDFARSWRLTRGRTWAVLGMCVITACLLGVVWIGAWILQLVLTGAVTGFDDLASLVGQASLEHDPGRFLLQLLLQVLFAPVLWVLSQAPLVATYEALREPQEGSQE